MNGAQPLLAQPHAEPSVVAVGSSAGDGALRAAAALQTEQQQAMSSAINGTANADPAATLSKAGDPQSNERYIEELYCKTPHSQHAHVLLGSEQSQRVLRCKTRAALQYFTCRRKQPRLFRSTPALKRERHFYMINNNAAQPPSVSLLATPALCDAEFFCDDTKEGVTSGQLVPDLIHDVELSMLAEQQLGGKRLRELDDDSKTIVLPWRIGKARPESELHAETGITEEHMPDATQAGIMAAPLLQRRVTE